MKAYTDRLSNGLRIIKIPKPDTEAVTVMLLIPAGSRYETTSTNGISHFLEHLMFKGTERRPSTLEITKLLDAVGAEYNAYTSKDHTAYYIKVAAHHFELTLDLFSDMVFHSLFDANEIQRERGVILEELNMYEDNPLMYLDVLLEMAVFGKNHPLGYDIGGPKKNIRNIPREAFIRYKKEHYFPGNMHLAVAGKLPKNTQQLIKKYFGSYKFKGKSTKPRKFATQQNTIQIMNKYKDTQQVQLAIGFPALHSEHPDLPALRILSVILGGNMSSRLFIQIRERQGLCYVIHADMSTYADTGIFSIQAGLDKQRIEPAVEAIINELKLVKEKPVTDEELNNAKEYIKGQTALKLEDSSALAGWYGKQSVLTKKLVSPTVKLKAIDQVTVKDVQRIANTILNPARLSIASIGPLKSINHLRKLVKL